MTNDILVAMKTTLDAHTWTSTAPGAILKGPIPAGQLVFPVLGIISDAGNEVGHGRGYADTIELYSWTMSDFLGLEDVGDQYLEMTDWRDEARVIARTAIDGFWGLSGAVQRTSLNAWETEYFEVPGPSGIRHLVQITLKMEVQYREQA